MRRPNRDAYELHKIGGDNLINRRFSDAFKILLSPKYNEGLVYSDWYNIYHENGQSTIYVNDIEMENQIHNFINEPIDDLKYLVGFTGIGKTTLIRNYFRVFDRDAKINNNHEIILYISLHVSNLLNANSELSLEDCFIRYLLRLFDLIWSKYTVERDTDKDFYNHFFDYIEDNNPTMTKINEIIPGNTIVSKSDHKIDILHNMQQKYRLEYYCFMLKFLLKQCSDINKVIIIFDDIESQSSKYHKPLVAMARSIQTCLTTMKDKKYKVKTIISLRAYTYRFNMSRQSEAHRESERSVLLKESVPSLEEIFELRFKTIAQQIYEKKVIGNIEAFEQAKKELILISNDLSVNFGKTIMELTNNNIYASFLLFLKILTNHAYFGEYEREHYGAYSIYKENYNYNAKSVFRALAYGEGAVYFDSDNNYLTNILHNHKEKQDHCELLGLYIIRYFISSRKNFKNTLYGINFEEGKAVVESILYLYKKNCTQDYINNLRERLQYMMNFLYVGGVLFRSIRDIEEPTIAESSTERIYYDHYKLYLSLRGYRLYPMLSENSLLFELYRDDIDTDLPNNDKCTCDLTQTEKLEYIISYIAHLFNIEMDYIQKADSNLSTYKDMFGGHFLVSPLLEGVISTTEKYYREISDKGDYTHIKNTIALLIDDINKYSSLLSKRHHVSIKLHSNVIKYISDQLRGNITSKI